MKAPFSKIVTERNLYRDRMPIKREHRIAT